MTAFRASLWSCLAVALLLAGAGRAEDECFGVVVRLTAADTETGRTSKYYSTLAGFGGNTSSTEGLSLKLVAASPLDACGPLLAVEGNALILVQRGICSFTDKALNVQAAGGKAMLLVNNEAGCVTMGWDSKNDSVKLVTIPLLSASEATGTQLLKLLAKSRDTTIQLDSVEVGAFDSSAILLFVIAVGTVVVGSLLSGLDHIGGKAEETVPLVSRTSAHGAGEQETVDISMKAAVGFVFISSAMLLVLFFFLSSAVFYILVGFFMLASIQSMTFLSYPLLGALLPTLRTREVKLPLLGGVPLLALVGAVPATALSVVWFVYRAAPWSWVLQDVQGVALMLVVFRALRLTSLRVACVLLPLAFAYDVFWVFIQPLLFGGPSVMVEVAEGGGAHEYMPLLLRVPRFYPPGLGGYSMLGFGDVILPGLLVAYARRLDIDRQQLGFINGYFGWTALGYAAGLALTFCALAFSWFGDQGQPALLYLVPTTLGAVLVQALLRQELRALMSSKAPAPAVPDHESDPGGDAAVDHMEAQVLTSARSSNAALLGRGLNTPS